MSAWSLTFEECENAILGYHDDKRYLQRRLPRSSRRIAGRCRARRSRNSTSGRRNPRLKTANFSGGNQQKIVLAREMERDPDVLIVGQPTRGVDIGAIEFIHNRIIEMRDAGKAVLLVSVELDEIRSLVRPHPRDVRRPHRRRARSARRPKGELGLMMAGVEGRKEAAE